MIQETVLTPLVSAIPSMVLLQTEATDSRSVPRWPALPVSICCMSLCGITHEAPGSCHTPATRAQMAAKQANYFNTKLWCPTPALWGHFGIVWFSLLLGWRGCLPWSYKDVKWVIMVIDRPRYSACCPDVKMVICGILWRNKGIWQSRMGHCLCPWCSLMQMFSLYVPGRSFQTHFLFSHKYKHYKKSADSW